jgi:hypothetical protein
MEFCASPQLLHNHRHRVKVITTQKLAAEIKHRKKSEVLNIRQKPRGNVQENAHSNLKHYPISSQQGWGNYKH